MVKKILKKVTWCLLLMPLNVHGQNLVLNPGFEEYHELQDKVDYIFYKQKFCLDCFFAKYWQITTWSGADYYNCKSDNYLFTVPENTFGSHPAKDGCAYIGFMPINWNGVSQHLTGTLKQSLEKGETYEVSFYIRHAGKASRFGFSQIGVHFHEKLFPLRYDPPLYTEMITPKHAFHIVADTDDFIFNDTSWTKITGTYTASGGEQYFTLGTFYLHNDAAYRKLLSKIRGENNLQKREKLMRSKKYQNIIIMKNEFEPVWHMPEGDPYYFIDMVSVVPLE